MGFDGKTLIHPNQIEPCNAAFSPSAGRDRAGAQDHRRVRPAGEQGQGRGAARRPHGRAHACRDGAAHGRDRGGDRGTLADAGLEPGACFVMSLELLGLAYVALACIVLVHRAGSDGDGDRRQFVDATARAPGLLNVAGTQLGLAVIMGIVVVGLASIIETLGYLVRLDPPSRRRLSDLARHQAVHVIGRARCAGTGAEAARRILPAGLSGAAEQSEGVVLFGAFIPQFVDPKGDYVGQVRAARRSP